MSKKVEVNSPFFMPILAAQNNISEGDGSLISPLPTPAGVVLRSSTVLVIDAARNNIPVVDGALILPPLHPHTHTPTGVVLRSGTVAVCNLHLPYSDIYFITLFIYNIF